MFFVGECSSSSPGRFEDVFVVANHFCESISILGAQILANW